MQSYKNALNNCEVINAYQYSQELFLLSKYYTKVWLCHDCVSANKLPAMGAIYFSQQLRDLFSRLDDEDIDQDDDSAPPLIENNISQDLTSVCKKCFQGLVSVQASTGDFPELPIPLEWDR